MNRERLIAELDRGLSGLQLPELGPVQRGKVRDCFTLGDVRVLVATDRISAFDRVFAELIPFKGQVLNQLAAFFMRQVQDLVPTHLVSVPDASVTVAREAKALPVEVIVRGYLTGSAWRDHVAGRFTSSYGIALPEGLTEHAKLPAPIVTPTTKAAEGHDLPLTHAAAAELVGGTEAWDRVVRTALELFERGTTHAAERGLILVDTKYEFGFIDGQLTLIDEVHTPDSSRYWYATSYAANPAKPEQLSKEFLREWLRDRGFTGEGPLPVLDDTIRVEVASRYLELYRTLTGQDFVPALGTAPATRIVEALREAGYLKGAMVAIFMGSASDRPLADKIRGVLDRFGVPSRLHVASAHKVPEKLMGLIQAYNDSDQPIVHITLAGRSNGLSGVTAGSARHPVIACPPFKDHADYLVNVHSSLQMPSETPVMTVLDPGNAALAAVRILSLADPALAGRVREQIAATKASFDEVLTLA